MGIPDLDMGTWGHMGIFMGRWGDGEMGDLWGGGVFDRVDGDMGKVGRLGCMGIFVGRWGDGDLWGGFDWRLDIYGRWGMGVCWGHGEHGDMGDKGIWEHG
jgi:hypothetical protein